MEALEIRAELTGSLLDLTPEIELALGLVVAKTALDVEARAKVNIMTGDKSGIVYKRKGGDHQASAPGEAPANDTGTLANSITTVPTGALESEVQVSADYAEDLELGTIRMQPRPFLGPALEAAQPGFAAAIEAVLG